MGSFIFVICHERIVSHKEKKLNTGVDRQE